MQCALQNKKQLKNFSLYLKQYKNLLLQSSAQKFSQVGNFADMDTIEFREMLEFWFNWQVFNIRKDVSKYIVLAKLSEALLGFSKNLNKKLILQSLFLNI